MKNTFKANFWLEHGPFLKGLGLVLGILSFFLIYQKAPAVNRSMDFVLSPVVQGATLAYTKGSTLVYLLTGMNIGLVSKTLSPEFLFKVRVATYINERSAGPLIEIAVDQNAPRQNREMAVMALLKFDSSQDWVQPFLNELAKGGMPELYQPQTPLLDALIKQIRSEGGIRNNLVRAYAEVVFSFMMQVNPQPQLRRRAVSWLSDVLAEDALFLLIPRIQWETDAVVKEAIENALWDIRAVSDPVRAIKLLTPIYRNPTWPEIKTPVAVILARLGHSGAVQYLNVVLRKEDMPEDRQVEVRIAVAQKPLPKELKISPLQEMAIAERRSARESQYQLALAREKNILKQEKTEQVLMAQVPRIKKDEYKSVPGPKEPGLPVPAAQSKPQALEEKTTPTAMAKKTEEQPPTTTGPVSFPTFSKEAPTPAQSAEMEPVPVKQELSADQMVAMLTKDTAVPPVVLEPERTIPKTPSMRGVDYLFEVTKDRIPLYLDPGYGQKAVGVLPKGLKGEAIYQMTIGEDKWYQVKSSKGNGWVHEKWVKIWDLTPQPSVPASIPGSSSLAQETTETSAYFEANSGNARVYEKPAPDSPQIGILNAGETYLAVKSVKIGPDRWFFLQLAPGKAGWVEGINLQLSSPRKVSYQEVSYDGKQSKTISSAFAPEWVQASVKGVTVYAGASVASLRLSMINPPKKYRVLSVAEGGGREWYRIQLFGGKEGWVQAMDVDLTKAN